MASDSLFIFIGILIGLTVSGAVALIFGLFVYYRRDRRSPVNQMIPAV